nr:uncharacterized protein LOC112027287 [Quercus suber]
MPPIFFQKFWSDIGDEVVQAMLSCLNSSKLTPGLNQTFISLIPKVKTPEHVTEFRPIALCNILYKLVSKVLANRLRKVLPHIISKSQSAFQSNKAISDNVLVAFESLHHMKRRKKGKVGHMALKLDMNKAYDSLLFCRAKVEDVSMIQEILGKYEHASGQKINSNKTTVFFSGNVPNAAKLQVQNLLRVPEIREYEKYLDLPAVVGRNKKASLNFIKDRVWGKLQDIEALVRRFWWGQRGDCRRIHWKKWEVLCKPKDEGGLGFKDLGKVNEAMLAKQVWRLVHDRSSLFYRVFKEKYFPQGSIFKATSSSASYAWKSILRSRQLIKKGAKWRLGDGQSIRIFIDRWLPKGDGKLNLDVSCSVKIRNEKAIALKLVLKRRASGEVALEDTLHALWRCDCLKEVWMRDFSWFFKSGEELGSFMELVKRIFMRPETIVNFAHDYLRDYKALQRCSSSVRCATPVHWSPPVREWWKVNFDGAMFGEFEEAGLGVVVRNSHSEVKATLTEKIRKPPSAEIAEVLAAKRATLFAQELGLEKMIFEGDSEQVIKALQWGGWDFASGGHLIRDIFHTVNSFMSTSFSHVCRRGNAVVHALAQRARQCRLKA